MVKDQYLVAIPTTIPAYQTIAQIRATDPDSGAFGELKYEILGIGVENFQIDPETGVVQNMVTFEDVDDSKTPFELIVIVHDNIRDSGNSNSQKTLLTVS